MSNSKVTNRSALVYAIENLPEAPAEIREKWAKMIAQLDKKNASPRKLTAQQEKNEILKSVIDEFLADNAGKGYTVSELLKAIPELEGDSNQHASALLRALVQVGSVEKYTEKRRTYFRHAG